MPKSRLFDNIAQVITVIDSINGTTTESTEVDLELPRGYVAKIHKVRVCLHDVFDKVADNEKQNFFYALLLDPDDTTTVQFPSNTVEHDVIVAGQFEIAIAAAVHGGLWNEYIHEWDFSHLEGLDVLSARNMRFNIVAGGAYMNDSEIECQIYYTLEKINDSQIMELLDIL